MTRAFAVEETPMDPRRDYRNFTDAALGFFIKRFPSHPDHGAAVAEIERRQQRRAQRVEPANERPARDNGMLVWAAIGILILALALLFVLLPIATARTNRKSHPPPSNPSSAAQGLSISTTSPAHRALSPEMSRHRPGN